MGQMYMDFRFLSDENMLPSGVYVNGLLDEMSALAQQLNHQVEAELLYAKGEIVKKSIEEVGKRANEQLQAASIQKYMITGSTQQYNTIYNAMAIQPITITYRIRETDTVGSS